MTLDDLGPIVPLDAVAAAAAAERQSQLLKPAGSLGRLEDTAIWMAGVSGQPRPAVQPLIVIAAADHGVAREGVSAYPQEVTGQMLAAFLGGGSAIAVMAKHSRADVIVIDAGVASPPRVAEPRRLVTTGLRPSANLLEAPALDEASVRTAIDVGRQTAADARARGINLVIGGDMGIANTTPATCLTAWLTGRDPVDLCGRGTGVDDEGLARKRDVIARALKPHGDTAEPMEALRRLGGGEIAVLCGLALGAGEHGLGYICDGLIATAAVAVAVAIAPDLRPRLIAGHRSPEPAHTALLEHLELTPLLDLGMRLGEGSGAATALTLIRLACVTHDEMATFAEAAVSGPRS